MFDITNSFPIHNKPKYLRKTSNLISNYLFNSRLVQRKATCDSEYIDKEIETKIGNFILQLWLCERSARKA